MEKIRTIIGKNFDEEKWTAYLNQAREFVESYCNIVIDDENINLYPLVENIALTYYKNNDVNVEFSTTITTLLNSNRRVKII